MHDCINCGCACYCHGDIDDCSVETIEYADMHCEGCGCEEEPDAGWPEEEIDGTVPETVTTTCPTNETPPVAVREQNTDKEDKPIKEDLAVRIAANHPSIEGG